MAGKKNTETGDLTTAILVQIRDELRETRRELGVRIDATNQKLDATNGRLDATNGRLERLEQRQTEDGLRIATELVAVARAVHQVRDLLQEQGAKDRIDDHERRLRALEAKSA